MLYSSMMNVWRLSGNLRCALARTIERLDPREPTLHGSPPRVHQRSRSPFAHRRFGMLSACTALVALGLGFASAQGCHSDGKDKQKPTAPSGYVRATPDASVRQSERPPAPSADGNVVTYAATSLGLYGFSANGRIHPHGKPTEYYFEYGPTTAYGQRTPVAPLGPKLSAHYAENFENGLAGWRGGAGNDLVHVAHGGKDGGGFVRYAEPTNDDLNHVDGIGTLHLVEYLYPGIFDGDAPTAALGGADPDFRDAKVTRVLRGVNWKPAGSELIWWAQADVAHGARPLDQEPHYANWGHTGHLLTDHLFSGQWETVSYRLWNDTAEWTYSGTNRELNAVYNRDQYHYASLDDVLRHLNIDFFHVLAFVDGYAPAGYPTGAIELDDIELAYRNHSLLAPSNGGKLVSAPPGSPSDPSVLTDGWRTGVGKTWLSAPTPTAPLEFVFEFARPVTVQKVQLHQHATFPSKDVEVLVSTDGGAWTPIVTDVMPEKSVGSENFPPGGANFVYLLVKGLSAPATKVKVRVLSGYRAEAWGLGEIELFGTGAQMETEDEFYRLNADITGLTAGQTVHYRLVATSDGATVAGGDQTYTVPLDRTPLVTTFDATRIRAGGAKVEGRINTLGTEAKVWFEYGPDVSYGSATTPKRAGPELTPRTVVDQLSGLTPGATVHYRVVVEGTAGTARGADASFVAK